jgi:peptidyl-prolyl cis-trans isomerase B (cyclophilin B)
MKTGLLLLGCVVLLTRPGPVGAEDRAAYGLRLKVDETEVTLGEEIHFTVNLTRKKGKAVRVNALRLARNSLSLRVEFGESRRTITRIYAQLLKNETGRFLLKDDPPPQQQLKKGKGLSLELPVLAIRPGKLRFRAIYSGIPKGKGPRALVSEPVEVTVRPPEGRKEIAARMETSAGTMVFTFETDLTYNTALNFLTLAKEGRYDGLTFHRIMKGFMAQGGDPKGDGTGGPGYYIHRDIDPNLRHVRGVLSMARADPPDTAGSQFFVMFAPKPVLDGAYAAFGRLVEGEKTLAKLEATPTDSRSPQKSRPIDPPVIRKVEVITR